MKLNAGFTVLALSTLIQFISVTSAAAVNCNNFFLENGAWQSVSTRLMQNPQALKDRWVIIDTKSNGNPARPQIIEGKIIKVQKKSRLNSIPELVSYSIQTRSGKKIVVQSHPQDENDIEIKYLRESIEGGVPTESFVLERYVVDQISNRGSSMVQAGDGRLKKNSLVIFQYNKGQFQVLVGNKTYGPFTSGKYSFSRTTNAFNERELTIYREGGMKRKSLFTITIDSEAYAVIYNYSATGSPMRRTLTSGAAALSEELFESTLD